MQVVTSLFVHKMITVAGDAIDRRAFLTSIGLDPDGPLDPKVMVADTAYYDLLERMAAEFDVTDLPLRTGASMRCDEYGALGLAWKAAPSLLGSFTRVERYSRLWTSVVEYEIRMTADGMLFILHRSGARRLGLRLSNEATLASAVAISREVSTAPFSPLEVHLKHGPPAKTAAHQSYFGCPVHFGSDLDALLIAPDALAQPNRLGDEGITRFLLGHLDQELARVSPVVPLGEGIKDIIARSLSEGVPKMEYVAHRLGMSVRSVHRRLAEHGLSFQTLTEETRRELAENLLRDQRYSLAEVAFLTGFSEQSAFTRAFKRWVGDTPAAYRKNRSHV
ncbi:MAG: AraC family transcriptional regulator [Pseudomonadota bacterium]